MIMGKSVNAFLAKAGSLIVELKERADVSPFIVSELNALFPKVKEAMAKIKELETNIESIAKTLKHYDLFQSALGVGPITAATMLVLLCNPEVFKNGREFAAYIGLAPKSSGSDGKNFVTHIPKKYECNNEVRTLLVQCAHAICRSKHKSDWVSLPDNYGLWLRKERSLKDASSWPPLNELMVRESGPNKNTAAICIVDNRKSKIQADEMHK